MRTKLIFLPLLIVALGLFVGCQRVGDLPTDKYKPAAHAESGSREKAQDRKRAGAPDGCSPEFRALFDQAVVEMRGKGDLDVVVVTDPLCWHCRLAHKLLGEYPKLYGRLRLSFFPRRSFIGSDMAAWIMEDAAGSDRLPKLIDFAYEDLQQPKSEDLMEARMIVLAQFTKAFPELLHGTTLDALYLRLQKDHESHVLESVKLARTAHLPGTPILVAGDTVVLGFGPSVWLKVLEGAQMCR
ncbi:hypothetical protein LF599_04905 [Pseudodesulfovibrio thermohalotolerans]|uniref:DsbA family protein n=1 Tax=Pseudodesulfovibrio thermohalotolerans TaxID=2880651 RepID=UPI0022B9DC1F|nr:hypothetical protein [Pseudodesulfovibrio thermohalotolerans]WFS63509.1 hypothetical protein LF599_04905 [Pseudodesulfovibrio thermohalotolerans]